jgi:hypothetical protein
MGETPRFTRLPAKVGLGSNACSELTTPRRFSASRMVDAFPAAPVSCRSPVDCGFRLQDYVLSVNIGRRMTGAAGTCHSPPVHASDRCTSEPASHSHNPLTRSRPDAGHRATAASLAHEGGYRPFRDIRGIKLGAAKRSLAQAFRGQRQAGAVANSAAPQVA